MKLKLYITISLTLLSIIYAGHSAYGAPSDFSISGQWFIKLDRKNLGETQKWYNQTFTDPIELPGSCEQRGYGDKPKQSEVDRLTHVLTYVGNAWYQREITIPANWNSKRVELFFERCQWESTLWIGDKKIGMRNSLSAPHVYDLGIMKPGKYKITVRVDNSYKFPIGTWVHAITEDTQGRWNGIIGKMKLAANDPVWIQKADVYTDNLKVKVGNETDHDLSVKLNGVRFKIPVGGIEVTLPWKYKGELWSEIDPHLFETIVVLSSSKFKDTLKIRTGIRTVKTTGRQFTINGRPTLMRGAVDECVYPLTGYPPMDKPSWMKILRINQSYGFNYMRFHSWCPPQAAFEAADDLGFMFQIELPFWTINTTHYGKDPIRDQFLKDELKNILDTYGHHPSFVFMAMGNESQGPLEELVIYGRTLDNRQLYRAENGFTAQSGDFFETGMRGIAGPRTNWNRWSMSGWIVGHGGDKTDLSSIEMPGIAHEMGQWSFYPDLDQDKKFTGTLRADFIERYKTSLHNNNMLNQAKDFLEASGKFSIQLIKDEIEGSMRTFPFGGFQMLEARDYPGQGVALVGWLDSFWDSKGFITPEKFREFCDTTVCLMDMEKRVFSNQDEFIGKSMVAHYGREPLAVVPEFIVRDEKGNSLYEVKLEQSTIHTGKVTQTGRIHFPLKDIKIAQRLIVTFKVGSKSNSWNIWVYPEAESKNPDNICLVKKYDESTVTLLESGNTVVLFSSPDQGIIDIPWGMYLPDSARQFKQIKKGWNSLPGSFMPVFWNFRLFNQIGVMGILCDPSHPALQNFPTQNHSDWQWADIFGRFSAAESFFRAGAGKEFFEELVKKTGDVLNRSKIFVLTDTPADFRPIVQVIDNYERNAKLGVVFETKVGKGKLLVCGLDLDTDVINRPSARQLRSSLLSYASSPKFSPKSELSPEFLDRLLN